MLVALATSLKCPYFDSRHDEVFPRSGRRLHERQRGFSSEAVHLHAGPSVYGVKESLAMPVTPPALYTYSNISQ